MCWTKVLHFYMAIQAIQTCSHLLSKGSTFICYCCKGNCFYRSRKVYFNFFLPKFSTLHNKALENQAAVIKYPMLKCMNSFKCLDNYWSCLTLEDYFSTKCIFLPFLQGATVISHKSCVPRRPQLSNTRYTTRVSSESCCTI